LEYFQHTHIFLGCLQLDDKSALLEISRQLELENVLNDKVLGSFSDTFDFLLRSFRTGGKESKPLVFILDEFDLFTKHKSQLLLYTLLNTLQVSSNPMFLIGLTCRLDVLDLLEKRIKSRFSHRQIYLLNEFNIDDYIELAKNMILSESMSILTLRDISAKMLKPYLDSVFDDNSIKQLLNRQFEYDKSIPTLRRLLLIPMIRLNKDLVKKKQADVFKTEFIKSYNMLNADTKSLLLNGISILELGLIIVMKQINEHYVDEPFNFDLVYNEYVKFCHKRNYGQKYEKQVILKVSRFLVSSWY
jgi:origin recognition complex subunit 4